MLNMAKVHLNSMDLQNGYECYEKAIRMFNESKNLDFYDLSFENWQSSIQTKGQIDQLIASKKAVYFQLITFYFYNNYHPMLQPKEEHDS